MADFYKFAPTLIGHEGEKYTEHPADPGGATRYGVTLETWRKYGHDLTGDGKIDKQDVKVLTKPKALAVYKRAYWDCLNFDLFSSQSLAEIAFDHGVNAGPNRAGKMLQYLLNKFFGATLLIDGKIGPKSLEVINSKPAKELFAHFKTLRRDFYDYRTCSLNSNNPNISFFRNELQLYPSAKAMVFRKGWQNRVASFNFKA